MASEVKKTPPTRLDETQMIPGPVVQRTMEERLNFIEQEIQGLKKWNGKLYRELVNRFGRFETEKL